MTNRLTCALCFLLLVLGAASAQAAPPSLAQVQAGTDAYLRTALHWDRQPRVANDVPDDLMPSAPGGYSVEGFYPFERPNQVDIAHSVVREIAHPRDPYSDMALAIIVHEDLHYFTGCYAPTDTTVPLLEEWITEAKALDELPFVSRAVWSRPLRLDLGPGGTGYSGGVKLIRALSMRATGSKSWHAPAAWAFRDALWRAPMNPNGCAVRSALMASPLR
jgi:hypothetical protein